MPTAYCQLPTMLSDLSSYLNRLDFLNEPVKQIKKDFGWSGLEIHFSGNADNAYQELFRQILPQMEKLLKETSGRFYELMYRIDISETQIKHAVALAKDRSFAEVVTDLILKRELQKVVMRKQYSTGYNPHLFFAFITANF